MYNKEKVGNTISQISYNVTKYKEINSDYLNVSYLENGNQLALDDKGNYQILHLLDKSGKSLGEIQVVKNVLFLDRWSNNEYVVFLTCQQKQNKYAADSLMCFKLNGFSQVGTITVKKAGMNLEEGKVVVKPLNDKTLICSYFGQVNIVDIATFQITKTITFCSNEKTLKAFFKEDEDTYWALSERGHLHKFKLDGT